MNKLVAPFAALDGCVYLNVHTDFAPGGEVRGQLLRIIILDR